ncbi:hypothetical protein OG252_52040 (plasmid) [Streptomyces sp. NBC_01352]|uniref:hypothetical protein n=1 Tax=Streptomyces sp. NBC_01352 TaxID=2903834 RepID=UPI002E2FFA8C|nr:hypothetical protein [Streptomyces sp. NBC_01352]
MYDERTGKNTNTRIEEAAASVQVTPAQKAAAYYLLDDLMAVAQKHGVQLSDLDAFTNLPTACLQVASTLNLTAE